ncbi:MAG: LysR family transcriptional regulator [Kofleriaceae bacterium]
MMTWEAARVLLAVARGGSMVRAARSLERSQPSVSRVIAELERTLGQPVFARHARGVRPTALGALLVEAAERVDSAMQGFERAARGAGAARGTVRVAASEFIGTEVIVPRLHELRDAFPGLAVELVLDNRASDLTRGEADVAVRMFRPGQPELITRRVARLELALYASADYLQRRGAPRTIEELLQHDLIGFDPRGAFAVGFTRIDARLAPEVFSLRSDSLTVHLVAARHGAGIAVLQRQLAWRYPELRELETSLQVPPLEVWLATHRELRRSKVVRVASEWLDAILREYSEAKPAA